MRLPCFAFMILACVAAGGSALAARVPWPLEYRDQSTNSFRWDERTQALVQSTTHHTFAPELLAALSGPPGPVVIEQDRYFSAYACVSHDCGRNGFLWLDTASGAGVGATYLRGYPEREGPLALDSTRIRGSIPEGARLAIVRWLGELEGAPTSVEFTDASGTKQSLPVASFTPPPHFVAPPGGPSFDCARASTRVEHTLCENPDLAAQDLQLSIDYRRMQAGWDRMSDRRQLTKVQKNWIQQRNLACENAADPSLCLAAQYKGQQDALTHWLPAPNIGQLLRAGAPTEYEVQLMRYRESKYNVLKRRDANERNASFNASLARHHEAPIRSCSLLIDVPVGTAHGNDSYGGICTRHTAAGDGAVMVCNDEMIGHFGLRQLGKRNAYAEDLAHFVVDTCFGG